MRGRFGLLLDAALRTVNGCHEFVIRTDESAYLDVLSGLGYGPLGEAPDEHLRRFPAVPRVEPIFQNFSRNLRPVLDQASRNSPTPWDDALAVICERAASAGLEWFLVGSTSLAARGLAVRPRDVDFVVPDHGQALEVFGDLLIQPPLFHPDTTFVSSWSGRGFAGARIEWVSFVHPSLDSWMWPNEVGANARANLELVRWRDWVLRVPHLALQLAVSEERGLTERAAAIRNAMQQNRP